jgi:transposase InsO family protein
LAWGANVSFLSCLAGGRFDILSTFEQEVIKMNMDIEGGLLVAAFRWEAIAPLVTPGSTPEDKRQHRRQILEREHFDPTRGRRRISAGCLKRWVKLYEAKGMAGLCPRPRRDKGHLVAFDAQVLERAIELRRESPRRTVKRLAELLRMEFPEVAISRGTLDRHLRARGWSRAALRSTAGPHIPFEMPYRNAMWTGDVLHGPNVVVDGELVRVKVFGFVDDYSRLSPHLEGYSDERLPALEDALQKGISKYGVPEQVFLDNALIFSSVQFELACGTLGINKIHSTPGYAPSRGKIERLFRTVRDELFCEIESLPPMPIEEFNRYLRAWVETVYHTRVHSRTGKSPLDRWEDPSQPPLRTTTPHTLQQAFLHWGRRKVGTTGEVKFLGNIYFADPVLAHKTVIIRYDPFDLSAVWLWREGEPMQRLTADRLMVRVMRRGEKIRDQRHSAAARKFLSTLSDDHQRELAREIRLIRFSDMPTKEEE